MGLVSSTAALESPAPLIPADETFDGTWPFAPRYFEGNGFRQHYVDEGPRDTGETFVLVHGEPTWGYLWRAVIPRLVRRGRVVVPDHMGFGKSETPRDRRYSAEEHSENLANLLLHLDLDDITLVLHDWGGPTGGQFGYRHPERVARVVVADSFVKPMLPPEMAPLQPADSTPWMAFIESDAFEPVMSHLGVTILSVLKKVGLERTEVADDTWVRAYASPFPTPADCRGALQFPRNLLLPETWRYLHAGADRPGAAEALARKPALLILGENDRTIPTELGVMMFRAAFPDGSVVTVPDASHFVTEDAPHTVNALIESFVESHPVRSGSRTS